MTVLLTVEARRPPRRRHRPRIGHLASRPSRPRCCRGPDRRCPSPRECPHDAMVDQHLASVESDAEAKAMRPATSVQCRNVTLRSWPDTLTRRPRSASRSASSRSHRRPVIVMSPDCTADNGPHFILRAQLDVLVPHCSVDRQRLVRSARCRQSRSRRICPSGQRVHASGCCARRGAS